MVDFFKTGLFGSRNYTKKIDVLDFVSLRGQEIQTDQRNRPQGVLFAKIRCSTSIKPVEIKTKYKISPNPNPNPNPNPHP